jgi:hypothetical protein
MKGGGTHPRGAYLRRVADSVAAPAAGRPEPVIRCATAAMVAPVVSTSSTTISTVPEAAAWLTRRRPGPHPKRVPGRPGPPGGVEVARVGLGPGREGTGNRGRPGTPAQLACGPAGEPGHVVTVPGPGGRRRARHRHQDHRGTRRAAGAQHRGGHAAGEVPAERPGQPVIPVVLVREQQPPQHTSYGPRATHRGNPAGAGTGATGTGVREPRTAEHPAQIDPAPGRAQPAQRAGSTRSATAVAVDAHQRRNVAAPGTPTPRRRG